MNLNLLEYLYKPNPPYVVDLICQLYRSGYSVIVLVCGKMRDGKTTKAFILSNWLSGLLFKKSWDWQHNTIVSFEQLVNIMHTEQPEILVMDEVQRQLHRKKWFKPESILFDELMTSQAYKHYIIFLICPKANTLGTDHANNLDFVIPVSERTLLQPYQVITNKWDITANPRYIPKKVLGHWNLDVENPVIKYVFKDELTHLDEYKQYINKNIKEKIMTDTVDKVNRKRFKQREQEILDMLCQ